MRCENRSQLFSCESLSLVEMGIYTTLRLILTLAAMFAPSTACQTLWQGLIIKGRGGRDRSASRCVDGFNATQDPVTTSTVYHIDATQQVD
jgi:hypothetical protein